MTTVGAILLSILAVSAAVLAVIFLLVPLFRELGWMITNVFRGIGWLFNHVFSFVFGMIGDVIRAVGAVIAAIVFTPLVVLNVVIGRWSAASHFGRALKDEFSTAGHCVYRVLVGRPARFFLLHGLVEGIENRLPEAVAQSPGSDRPSRRTGQFEGYTIVGSLQGGGSGGRLYVAEPDDRKKAIFARAGRDVGQVVIKTFSLHDGSSLPQIIRESRALEAAKKLGLVLDHELTDERFFYVMEYVPGDSLTVVTKRLHSEAGPSGLGAPQLAAAMGYISDLLAELASYHRGGLWHKDVKPDNIIVSGERARLVDLGLVTPLRSAMTLTTHGTEYFRDPELVRMALRGAKVRDVDGVKFDIYGVGAVLYSVVENSFPAHGGLSQVSKKCPEALRWVIRRAMTELHNRYASADEMLADLRTILSAPKPFALMPADLPSVKGGEAAHAAMAQVEAEVQAMHAGMAAAMTAPAPAAGAARDFSVGPAPMPTPAAGGATPPRGRSRPAIFVTDWLTGRYVARNVDGAMPAPPGRRARAHSFCNFRITLGIAAPPGGRSRVHAASAGMPRAARTPHSTGSASELLARAHERVRRAQDRAAKRMSGRRIASYSNRPNAGVALASLLTVGGIAAFVGYSLVNAKSGGRDFELGLDGLPRVIITTDAGDVPAPVALRAEDGSIRISDSQLQAFADLGRRVKTQIESRVAMDGADRAHVALTASSSARSGAAATVNAPRGTVLVLNTLPGDIVAQERGTIESLAAGLRRSGFLVQGLGSSPEDTDLLARGKRIVELSTPRDEEAVERVRQWLNDRESGLDAALWIGQGGPRGSVVRRLIVRDGLDPESIILALPSR